MSKWLDRMMPVLVLISAGFLLMLLGTWAGSQRWMVARAYDAVLLFVHKGILQPDGLTNEVMKAPETKTLLSEEVQTGDTLITRGDDSVLLIGPDGEEKKKWQASYETIWNRDKPDGRSFVHISDAHLYDNGDLLVLYRDTHNNEGVGMARLDKDAKLLWKYTTNVHDHVSVSGGKLYTILQAALSDTVRYDQKFLRPFNNTDEIAILSEKDGKLLDVISLIDAFIGTPFEQYLYSYGTGEGNRLRATSVRVLDKKLAAKYPHLPAGALLVTIKNFHTIVILDPTSGKVVWAMRSIWQKPDDALFAEDGRIWVLDNEGYYNGKEKQQQPRLVSLDPATHLIGETILIPVEVLKLRTGTGRLELLPNGNFLVALGNWGMILELNKTGHLVWQHTRDEIIYGAQRIQPAAGDK